MTTKQISVFLENKTGRLNEITRILAEAQINLRAFCLAEASDFGILRMVVSDSERAITVLKDHHIAVRETEVICLETPNTPGSLNKVLDQLEAQGVFIEYMYAFSEGDTARTIIRPTDIAKCVATIKNQAIFGSSGNCR